MAHDKGPHCPTQGHTCSLSFNHNPLYVDAINSRFKQWRWGFKGHILHLLTPIPSFPSPRIISTPALVPDVSPLPQDLVSCQAGAFCLTPVRPTVIPTSPEGKTFVSSSSFFPFCWVSVWSTCVYVFVCGGMCVYACACGGQRSVFCSPQSLRTLLFETVSH